MTQGMRTKSTIGSTTVDNSAVVVSPKQVACTAKKRWKPSYKAQGSEHASTLTKAQRLKRNRDKREEHIPQKFLSQEDCEVY